MIQIRDLTWRESEIINAGRCIVFSRKQKGIGIQFIFAAGRDENSLPQQQI